MADQGVDELLAELLGGDGEQQVLPAPQPFAAPATEDGVAQSAEPDDVDALLAELLGGPSDAPATSPTVAAQLSAPHHLPPSADTTAATATAAPAAGSSSGSSSSIITGGGVGPSALPDAPPTSSTAAGQMPGWAPVPPPASLGTPAQAGLPAPSVQPGTADPGGLAPAPPGSDASDSLLLEDMLEVLGEEEEEGPQAMPLSADSQQLLLQELGRMAPCARGGVAGSAGRRSDGTNGAAPPTARQQRPAAAANATATAAAAPPLPLAPAAPAVVARASSAPAPSLSPPGAAAVPRQRLPTPFSSGPSPAVAGEVGAAAAAASPPAAGDGDASPPAVAAAAAACAEAEAPLEDEEPHERALRLAQDTERQLVTGGSQTAAPDPLAWLQRLLADARADWNPRGRPDASGAMIGGAVLLRLEAPGEAAVGDLALQWAQYGRPRAVAVAGQLLALGTANGVVVMVQQPPSSPHQGAAAAAPGAAAPPPPAVWALGDARGGPADGEAVTALAFSAAGAPGEPVWLAAGHASGVVALWEVTKRGGRLMASIGQHSAAVVHVSFFPGRGTSALLSADRRGRLVLHTFSSLLLRTSVASRVLGDGQLGTLVGVHHLAPFLLAPPPTPAAGATSAGAGAGGGARELFEDAAAPWRVGEGVALIATTSSCYVARFKPSGDLVMLYSIPHPGGVAAGAPPAAAWLPHFRRPAVARVARGEASAPVAVLAMAWGPQLVVFEVPLIGDHSQTGADGGSGGGTASGGGGAAGGGGGGGGDALPARRRRQQQLQQLEALTQQEATQLATTFELSISGMWSGANVSGQFADAVGAAAPPPPEQRAVLALHWLDADALLVVRRLGLSTQLVVLDSELNVREQLECTESPLDSGNLPGSFECSAALAGLGPRLYVLGVQGGLHVARLMAWSERLRTLQDIRKHKLGLHYAVGFYVAAQQRRASGLPSSGAAGGSLGRSEGWGAEPPQLEQWLLSLMLGHVTTALADAAAADPRQPAAATAAAAAAAAGVAIATCLLLGRAPLLSERVFPLFARAGAPPGALAAFVEALEGPINADAFERLAPEVVQALVEHFAAIGAPERVERCVLHLNVLSLDLNQVIRLCETHQLLSALVYIHNRISDYRRPLLELLAACATACDAGDAAGASRVAYKLLVYLRGVFRGEAFPPGSGQLVGDARQLDEVKAQLLGCLLFLDSADLAAEWAALWRARGSDGAALPPPPPPRVLRDPHPALQLLMSVDAAATLAVLQEATRGWDAVETDLRAAAGKPALELDRVLVATQVVVDAIVSLLESGTLGGASTAATAPVPAAGGAALPVERTLASPASAAAPAATAAATAAAAAAATRAALQFVTKLLAEGRVTVRASFALRLLQHLAGNPHSGDGAAAAAASDIAAAAQPPALAAAGAAAAADAWPRARPAARESLFTQVVRAVGVNAPGRPADPAAFSPAQAQAALRVAQAAGMRRAAAALQHLCGDYGAALAGHLHSQDPHGAFRYAHGFLAGDTPPLVRQQFTSALQQHVAALVALDAPAAAELILSRLPDQQATLFAALQPADADGRLQFAFLRALLSAQQLLQARQRRRPSPPPPVAADRGAAGGGDAATAGAAPRDSGAPVLLSSPEVVDTYVRLLCAHAPAEVLPFLQGHEVYDVRGAIRHCRAHGVADAEAYLHERLGDMEAALQLHLSGLAAAADALDDAVLSGRLPVLLPVAAPPAAAAALAPVDREAGGEEGRRGVSSAEALAAVLEQMLAPAARAPSSGAPAAALDSVASVDSHLAASTSGAPAAAAATSAAQRRKATFAAAAAARLAHAGSSDGRLLSSSFSSARSAASSLEALERLSLRSAEERGADPAQHCAAALAHDAHVRWLQALAPRLWPPRQSRADAPRGGLAHSGSAARAGSSFDGGGGNSGGGGRGNDAPPQLRALWQALQAAMAFCARMSKSAAGHEDVRDAHSHWFALLNALVARLRRLQREPSGGSAGAGKDGVTEQRRVDAARGPGGGWLEAVCAAMVRLMAATQQERPAARAALVVALERARRAAGAAALRDIYGALLDELIGRMADHLALLSIVQRVLSEHSGAAFGEFRGTLLGLFAAYAYEHAIMGAANRLITRDAFRRVREARALRARARDAVVRDAGGGGGGGGGDDEAEEEEGAPADVPTAAAALVPSAVEDALRLGVLGRGHPGPGGAAGSGGGGGAAGGPPLPLAPAGDAPRGQFVAARAVAALRQGRRFYGAINLAAEMAALHQAHNLGSLAPPEREEAAADALPGAEAATHARGAGRTSGGDPFDVDALLAWSAAQQ